ncbi:MAG TPA: protein phosphatase 2C domain-containing protein [Candidatus Saccharimonadales bacterium]|nr:protein phosphatase 2C domain-containing protein [Candidatus Saccharimonadales bacterium]
MPRNYEVSSISYPGTDRPNEDSLLIDTDSCLLAVFDGASSITPDLYDGQTGAYIASHIAAEVFAKTAGDFRAKAEAATNAIEAAHQKYQVDVSQIPNRFMTTVAAARVGDAEVELFQLGDSVPVVAYRNGQVETPLIYNDQDADIMRRWRTLADAGRTGIRQLVAENVLELRGNANRTFGVLNGDPAYANFIQSKTLKISDVATILLLTDGLFMPKSDPNEPENWQAIYDLYTAGGLEALYAKVREVEDSDPELQIYPRYKLHDDATAIAIDFI